MMSAAPATMPTAAVSSTAAMTSTTTRAAASSTAAPGGSSTVKAWRRPRAATVAGRRMERTPSVAGRPFPHDRRADPDRSRIRIPSGARPSSTGNLRLKIASRRRRIRRPTEASLRRSGLTIASTGRRLVGPRWTRQGSTRRRSECSPTRISGARCTSRRRQRTPAIIEVLLRSRQLNRPCAVCSVNGLSESTPSMRGRPRPGLAD